MHLVVRHCMMVARSHTWEAQPSHARHLKRWCFAQAEALENGSASSLCGVRLPEDMPPGVAYLEVEHGPHVGQACAVVVMPPGRFMAAAEVLQLLRGDAIAACSRVLGA